VKIRPYILLLAFVFIFPGLYAQVERYQHPVYDISFEASPNWKEKPQDAESQYYSVVNPNHNMEISLRYIPDCRRPEKYMRRMSGLKGLVCHRGAYDTILNHQKAVVMSGNGLEGRESYSTIIIGFPKDNGLYLMEISCPENCTAVHLKRVRTILQTVRIGPVSPGGKCI